MSIIQISDDFGKHVSVNTDKIDVAETWENDIPIFKDGIYFIIIRMGSILEKTLLSDEIRLRFKQRDLRDEEHAKIFLAQVESEKGKQSEVKKSNIKCDLLKPSDSLMLRKTIEEEIAKTFKCIRECIQARNSQIEDYLSNRNLQVKEFLKNIMKED